MYRMKNGFLLDPETGVVYCTYGIHGICPRYNRDGSLYCLEPGEVKRIIQERRTEEKISI